MISLEIQLLLCSSLLNTRRLLHSRCLNTIPHFISLSFSSSSFLILLLFLYSLLLLLFSCYHLSSSFSSFQFFFFYSFFIFVFSFSFSIFVLSHPSSSSSHSSPSSSSFFIYSFLPSAQFPSPQTWALHPAPAQRHPGFWRMKLTKPFRRQRDATDELMLGLLCES